MKNKDSGKLTASIKVLWQKKRGIGLLAPLAFAALLPACNDPYNDLEASFKTEHTTSVAGTHVTNVRLTSTSKPSEVIKEGLSITLLPASIEIDPEFPYTVALKPLAIRADQIAGCSMTCSGDGSYADLLISSTGTEISFRKMAAVIDWCWDNKIPIISSKDRREWLYAAGTLPNRSKFLEQLSSRGLYLYQAQQSCLGY